MCAFNWQFDTQIHIYTILNKARGLTFWNHKNMQNFKKNIVGVLLKKTINIWYFKEDMKKLQIFDCADFHTMETISF